MKNYQYYHDVDKLLMNTFYCGVLMLALFSIQIQHVPYFDLTSKTEVLQTPSAIEVNLGQGVK